MQLSSKQYTVYIHSNKLNDKKYVGITSQNPNRRWQNNIIRYCLGNRIDRTGRRWCYSATQS